MGDKQKLWFACKKLWFDVKYIWIEEGKLEKCKNDINSLRSFLYPNVAFEIIANCYENKHYLLLIVRRQTGGPFIIIFLH